MSWIYEEYFQNPEHPDLLIAIPNRFYLSQNWVGSLLQVRIPFRSHQWKFDTGNPIDISRNISCTTALQNRCRYLLFIDADVLLPPDAVEKLVAAKRPIVSGAYRSRGDPYWWIANRKGKPITDEEFNNQGPLVEVDEVGMGACLIDTRVLLKVAQKLKEWRCFVNHSRDAGREVIVVNNDEAKANDYRCPYCKGYLISRFFWHRGGMQNVNPLSEDYYFCKLARESGFKIYVHNQVQCSHENFHMQIGPNGLVNTLIQAGVVR